MNRRRTVLAHQILLAALLSLVLIVGDLVSESQDGGAQTSPTGTSVPEADGFRLVARVLPDQWDDLAVLTATPAVSGTSPSALASPTADGLIADTALVEALRGGGYVIYFRHASTDFAQPDTDRENLANCATQRNLDAQGRAAAAAIGGGFRALGLPVGQVLSSEYCRTRETAELAFGRVTPTRDLTSRANAPDDERARRRDALRCLLATPPEPGTNSVLVGHNFNLQDATGLSLAEGEAAVFAPRAGGGCSV
jgi:phosphohistidine phosphatase SixA